MVQQRVGCLGCSLVPQVASCSTSPSCLASSQSMGFSWQAYAYLLLHAVCQYPMSRAHYMVKHKPKLWRGAQCPACSAQFICSVVSDSLRPHELQHARPPCPSGRMFSFPYVQPQNCYFTPCLGTGMFDTISNILTPGVHV